MLRFFRKTEWLRFALIAGLLLLAEFAIATHNRAGEIVFKRIDSNPFRYEISIITYTKTGGKSDQADRCELELFFGYNLSGTQKSEVIQRVNGGPGNNNCPHGGEMIATDIKYNVYTTTHTFPGAGAYTVFMLDPNRNEGVVNMSQSGNVPFYLESTIVIDGTTGGNNAPVLQNPPIDNGCVGIPYYHNPGAVDVDGDSLFYSIVASQAGPNEDAPGFRFPDEVSGGADNLLTIDERSGTLIWDSPQEIGEYNVAILIQEFRYLENSGERIYMGSVLRDMQISIGVCTQEPPLLVNPDKVCIEVGSTHASTVSASDPDGDLIELSATGYPIENGQLGLISPSNPVEAFGNTAFTFQWSPGCEHVQYEPYWMYYKVKEQRSLGTELASFSEMEIQVVAPRVEITEVSPQGARLNLTWTSSNCAEADGYDIYRHTGQTGFIGTDCETGVPAYTGYKKIGRVDGVNNTAFTDDDDGLGLVHGQEYCYMVVVTFDDRSESFASFEACGELIRNVPIVNKVSVISTDAENGADSVAWFKPTELDLAANGPPYQYVVLHATAPVGPYDTVLVSGESQDVFALDTAFVHAGINTLNLQHYYKVQLLSASFDVGGARFAGSVYLTSTPADNQLNLSWESDVPWTNTKHRVYKFSTHPDSLDSFTLLATTTEPTYIDTALKNGRTYRYFVITEGAFTATDLNKVLMNKSQIHSGTPADTEAPCVPPRQRIEGDCDLDATTLVWGNPNTGCSRNDDAIGYRIYFAPLLGQAPSLLEEISDLNDTTYSRTTDNSIAGCYAITAIDSFGNETTLDAPLCIDNCPVYELPNVFTPGSDGQNDLFGPFPYRYVSGIELLVFNRWGRVVFTTTDPDINWNGTDQNSGKPLSEGTYYFQCLVNELRLGGTTQREIKGHVTLLRAPEAVPAN